MFRVFVLGLGRSLIERAVAFFFFLFLKRKKFLRSSHLEGFEKTKPFFFISSFSFLTVWKREREKASVIGTASLGKVFISGRGRYSCSILFYLI